VLIHVHSVSRAGHHPVLAGLQACAGSSSARHPARTSFGARGTSSPQLRRQALASGAAAVPAVPMPARWPVAACCSSSSQAPSRMTPATVTPAGMTPPKDTTR